MSRITLLTLSVMIAAAGSAAGEDDARGRSRAFALFGGSMTTMTRDGGDEAFSVNFRRGLNGAAGLEHPVTDDIAVQLRVSYNQNGAALTSSQMDTDIFWEFDYFEFSALTQIGNGLFHGLVGASMGVAWGCSISTRHPGYDETTDCMGSEAGDIGTLDFGLHAGIGTPEWNRMFVNVIYTEGLQNTVNPGVPGRNRSIRFLLGIYVN
ncbi:MAG: PorT family protein [Acidobacteria bacterium]|nr:PorT family protein [Acidobacteriota bacterium]MYH50356.1 PorT family protein [Gammaproteobacteria bacterium]MYK79417.1 PorT family protein [Acidobacteriota bacterium]